MRSGGSVVRNIIPKLSPLGVGHEHCSLSCEEAGFVGPLPVGCLSCALVGVSLGA